MRLFLLIIRRFNSSCSFIISKILVVLTIAMLLSINLQVLSRLVRFNVIWTSDVAIFSFVWTAFLGAALAVTANEHFIVDIFPKKIMTPLFDITLSLLALTLQFITGFVLLRYGIRFTESMSIRFSFSLGIKMSYISCVLPVSGFLIITGSLERLLSLKELIGSSKKEMLHE